MGFLADLYGTVTVADVGPVLLGTVTYAPTVDTVVGTIEVDGRLGIGMFPNRLARPIQRFGFALLLDGVPVPMPQTMPPLNYSLDRQASVQTFTLSLPIPNALGSPAAALGAPPGSLRRLDLLGRYLTIKGMVEVPLITNGMVVSCAFSINADGQRIMVLNGADAAARYDGRRITYVQPAGHGLGLGEHIRRMCLLAGWPVGAIPSGPIGNKPVNVQPAQAWLSTAREMAASMNMALVADQDGAATLIPVGYSPGRRAAVILTDRDLLRNAGTTEVDPVTAVLTRVTYTGSAQLTTDPNARTITFEVVQTGPYDQKHAAFRQNSDGSLSPTGDPAPTPTPIASRVETYREMRGQVVISELILTYGWANPEAARYLQHSTGDPTAIAGVYLYGGAAGDQTTAYQLRAEVWGLVNVQLTTNVYGDGVAGRPADGYLISTTVVVDSPRWTHAALKSRTSPATPWTSATPIDLRRLLADGTGVVELYQVMPDPSWAGALGVTRIITAAASQATTTYSHTADGYQTGTNVETLGLRPDPGVALYLYKDVSTSPDGYASETDVFASVSDVTTSLTAADGGSTHNETQLTFTPGLRVGVVESSGVGGYLPEAPRDTTILDAAAGTQSPGALQSIEGNWISYQLEAFHNESDVTRSDNWIETPEGLEARAKSDGIEAAAIPVTVTLPIAFGLRMDDKLLFQDMNGVSCAVGFLLGLDPPDLVDVDIQQVQGSWQGDGQAATTTVVGRWYPVVE